MRAFVLMIAAFCGSVAQAAAAQRRRILALAAEKNYWVAGAHLSFPGMGHVRAEEENYLWVPVNYTIPD